MCALIVLRLAALVHRQATCARKEYLLARLDVGATKNMLEAAVSNSKRVVLIKMHSRRVAETAKKVLLQSGRRLQVRSHVSREGFSSHFSALLTTK